MMPSPQPRKPSNATSKACSWMENLFRRQSLYRFTRLTRRSQLGHWALVDVDMSKLSDKSVRVNITMPARVLAVVDAAASRAGESRSALLTHAALEYISR